MLGQSNRSCEDSPQEVVQERIDEIGVLGEGDKLCGRDDAADRVMPAGEHFKACELASPQLDERLEVRHNLVAAVECSAEI